MTKKTAVKSAKPAPVTVPVQPVAPAAEPLTPAKLQLKAYDEAVRQFAQKRLADALSRFLDAAAGPDSHVADKARSYAQVCERRTRDTEITLQSSEDHFNYGVERLNERDFERAMRHFEKALALEPRAEHVYYTMSLCCGLAGDGAGACENLKRAIELEPKNRILARQDPEFAAIMPEFSALRGIIFDTSHGR